MKPEPKTLHESHAWPDMRLKDAQDAFILDFLRCQHGKISVIFLGDKDWHSHAMERLKKDGRIKKHGRHGFPVLHYTIVR